MKRYDFDAQRGIMMVEKDGFWISHDDYLAAERERDALAARAEWLHKALRKHCVVTTTFTTTKNPEKVRGNICNECGRGWSDDARERHAEGCAAAP